MIYSVFVKKQYKATGISPVLTLINRFSLCYGKSVFVVCLPGYLSKTSSTLDSFADNFPRKKTESTLVNEGYFFSGINGGDLIKGSITCQNYINTLYGSYTTSFIQPKDHSKIAIFFKKDETLIIDKNIDKLIRKGEVFAILIGSSNQSHNTYIKSPSDKGEADILLIDGDFFNNNDEDVNSIIKNVFTDPNLYIFTKEVQPTGSLKQMKNDIFEYKDDKSQ